MFDAMPTTVLVERNSYAVPLVLAACLLFYITGRILVRMQRRRFWVYTSTADTEIKNMFIKAELWLAKKIKAGLKNTKKKGNSV